MSHGLCLRLFRALALGATLFSLSTVAAVAGPPFVTDDPEPTDYRHFEIYVASDYARGPDGVAGTLPHLEANYGVMPNVQFTVTLPFASWQQSHSPMYYGYGDTEFEVKARVVQETGRMPQISVAPTIDVPTGNAATGLGAGYAKAFFPVWLEKGFGRYTIYGGGGFWHNPGDGNKNYTFSGLTVERDMGGGFTVGTEIFGQSADTIGGSSSLGFSVGAVKDLGEHHKILLSVGRSLHGTNTFSGYAAYELYLGPHEKPDADKPDADKADGDKPAADASNRKQPDADTQAADKPGADKVDAAKPAAETPAAAKPKATTPRTGDKP